MNKKQRSVFDNKKQIASYHSSLRADERAGLSSEELLMESDKMGLLAETETHKYKRNDDYVVVLKKNTNEDVIKTIMDWDTFKKNLQTKIEKYN